MRAARELEFRELPVDSSGTLHLRMMNVGGNGKIRTVKLLE
jgi:hypothetical protein